MAVLATEPFLTFFDDNGNPLSGGLVYTYSAGTTTPKATYTDAGGLTPNSNPVVLDAAGRANIWLSDTGSYRIDVKTSTGTLVRTTDNITAFSTGAGLTVSDASFTIRNNTDASKKAMFSAAGVPSGTTITLTLPGSNGTIALLSDIGSTIRTVKRQSFSSSGTYTPSAGMVFCDVEIVGGGGGGGGSNGGAAVGSGGGAGGYSRRLLTAAQIGSSQTVTIGSAGSAGSSSGGDGGSGGTTSLGSLLTANGGAGGLGSTSGATFASAGGVGGSSSSGDINRNGNSGGVGFTASSGVFVSGAGASSKFGAGGASVVGFSAGNGNPGNGFGSGGSGARYTASSGGVGTSGYVFITEFCSQ